MLQQAVEQLLRQRGWEVVSEGRVVTATKNGGELVIGFVTQSEATAFAARIEGSSAVLAAVLLEPFADDETLRLEQAGISCFSREEVEDVVVNALQGRADVGDVPFAQRLEGG